MSRVDEIYARIAEADRPEVFIALRPQAEAMQTSQVSGSIGPGSAKPVRTRTASATSTANE